MKWIAVAQGRKPGIYPDWKTAQTQVSGFPKAVYKGFQNKDEAISFMSSYGLDGDGNPLTTRKEVLKYAPLPVSSGGVSDKPFYTPHSIPHYCFYTDGSADNNNKSPQGGVGLVVTDPSRQHMIYQQGYTIKEHPFCTNNIAELSAVHQAMCYLDQSGFPSNILIHFYIDSTYVINHLIQRSIQPSQPNYAKVMMVLEAVRFIENKGFTFTWIHIDAHVGNRWNEVADQLANAARLQKV